MIQPTHIKNLLSQIATTSNSKELNASLPMLLRVLDKKGANKYIIQLGKLIIETQSNKELNIGANYWANVKQDKNGLLISDLIQQPKLLENIVHARLKLSSNDLKELLNDAHNGGKNIELVFKEFLIDRLPLASTKQEFLELSNLLVALQNGIFSMVIKENDGKESLIQIKKQIEFLEFYSIFNNLGEISGTVSLDERSNINLRICVMNEKIKRILENNIDKLSGFSNIQIDIGKNLPLWDIESFETSYILDLKG